MFTGLVEEKGECRWLKRTAHSVQLAIAASLVTRGLKTGESVAVNGCCLTATQTQKDGAVFDLLEETLARTNLGDLRPGSPVNLERALAANARLGGHFVQGHVDDTCEVISVSEKGPDLRLEFSLPATCAPYIAFKGSVAINGVSLTVAELKESSFVIWIIPHTRTVTNLGELAPGKRVNLETDILAKYAERILAGKREG